MNKIDTSGWKSFKIGDLFIVSKGKRLTKADMVEGNINFIGASSINNGITAKISNCDAVYSAGCITVSYNGSVGESFYQDEKFWASDDVNVLYLKNHTLTKNIAMFIIPILRKTGQKYAFINKWKKEDMENDSILLPATADSIPDFAYMESYMQNLECAVRASLAAARYALR